MFDNEKPSHSVQYSESSKCNGDDTHDLIPRVEICATIHSKNIETVRYWERDALKSGKGNKLGFYKKTRTPEFSWR